MNVYRRKAVILPFKTAAGAIDLGVRVEGWDIMPAPDVETAKKIVENDQVRVGLLMCDCRPRRWTTRYIEAILDEMESVPFPMQWLALIPDRCKDDDRMDDRLRQVIAERFFDFHTLPVDSLRLGITLGHAYGKALLIQAPSWERDRCEAVAIAAPIFQNEHGMVGMSPVMRAVFRDILKIASVDAPVLISGETGTGKELAVRAIHKCSARANGPFVAVNCAALPASLVQAELFGHEKGAFTGAHQRTPGRIELAEGGTLFLDEIGDLALDLQVNLLRFLQEGTIERVGGRKSITVDARVIAATHTDLEHAIEQGRFREDLYHRIHVLYLTVPPLRERGADVILLARFLLEKYAAEVGRKVVGFSREALEALSRHPWPGNVRELTNCIKHAVVMCDERLITSALLGSNEHDSKAQPVRLDEARSQAEITAIDHALKYTGYNISRAADALGISRCTLYRLMERYGLDDAGAIAGDRSRG